MYLDSGHVSIASVDCSNIASMNPILCAAQEVESFPTISLYKEGQKLVSDYKGKRQLEDLTVGLKMHLDIWEKEKHISQSREEL